MPPARAGRWRGGSLPLAAAGTLAVLYAGLCKVLLFQSLEYDGADLYSFLDMSWSWLYSGRVLWENAYGNHAAIHNFYLLPALSPLTIPFGVYGLFIALLLLELLAVVRVATAAGLAVTARIAVLAGLLSPVAYFVFDDRDWGFHPELCYPPLAVLLALDLRQDRHRRAALAALAMVLVKEDGALLCAGVLVAHFAERLWSLRKGPRDERDRLVRAALGSLAALALVFVLGLLVLWLAGQTVPAGQASASARTARALGVLGRTLSGEALPERRAALLQGLAFYGLVALALLVPLGARFGRGLLLLLASVPGVAITLAVSAASYKFGMMQWAPRVATLLALVLACLVVSAQRLRPAGAVVVLAAVSWAVQLPLLAHAGYPLRQRLDAPALARARARPSTSLSEPEVRLLRCVAGRLPRGLSVSLIGEAHPFFHHQSIVFQNGLETRPRRPPKLRVIPSAAAAGPRQDDLCLGPRVGALALEIDCALLPSLASCGILAQAGSR